MLRITTVICFRTYIVFVFKKLIFITVLFLNRVKAVRMKYKVWIGGNVSDINLNSDANCLIYNYVMWRNGGAVISAGKLCHKMVRSVR